MQQLIEKMERAIAIDKQDAASSDVTEIKTVARYRWPMLEQFANELKDVSAAVDTALDVQKKLVATLAHEVAAWRGIGDTAVVNEYMVAASSSVDGSYLEEMSRIGWELVTVTPDDNYDKVIFRRPLPSQ